MIKHLTTPWNLQAFNRLSEFQNSYVMHTKPVYLLSGGETVLF